MIKHSICFADIRYLDQFHMLMIDSIMRENTKEFVGELYKYFKGKFAPPNSVKLF